MSSTLNRTVAHGVRLSAVHVPTEGTAYVGVGASKHDLAPRIGFPFLRAPDRPLVYMVVSYRLRADEERNYLMVQNSVVALAVDQEMTRELLHVDYERDKADDYPEAHLQVAATSAEWEEVSPDRSLQRLHLPVGPRRFRPSLENVIEFLAREGLTNHREDWREVVDGGRHDFQRRQLRAAIRRSPEVAKEILSELET
ncbi:MAG: hypothetical protein PIR02_05965 [Microbacterium enclense]